MAWFSGIKKNQSHDGSMGCSNIITSKDLMSEHLLEYDFYPTERTTCDVLTCKGFQEWTTNIWSPSELLCRFEPSPYIIYYTVCDVL